MILNSLKLILQEFFVPSARVEPIYLKLNKHRSQQSFWLKKEGKMKNTVTHVTISQSESTHDNR